MSIYTVALAIPTFLSYLLSILQALEAEGKKKLSENPNSQCNIYFLLSYP